MSQKLKAVTNLQEIPLNRGIYYYIAKTAGPTIDLEIQRPDGSWESVKTWVSDEVGEEISLPDCIIRVTLPGGTDFEYAPSFARRL